MHVAYHFFNSRDTRLAGGRGDGKNNYVSGDEREEHKVRAAHAVAWNQEGRRGNDMHL